MNSLPDTVPALEGARVTLREMTAAEVEGARTLPGAEALELLPPLTVEALRLPIAEEIAHHRLPPWNIISNGTGRSAGTCAWSNWHLGHARGRFGIAVMNAAGMEDDLAEAIALVLRFGFASLRLERAELLCILPEQGPIARAAEGAGMVHECTLRRYLREGGRLCDAALYAMIRSDHSGRPLL